ncbi:hypothetical protein PENSPDRAFT_215498 [Peniophora sp. CONT]|nr:hypothetical protein PENSPDRAFT_215498 [Peniophora sp. CONT]
MVAPHERSGYPGRSLLERTAVRWLRVRPIYDSAHPGQTSALAPLTGLTDVPLAREHPAHAHFDVCACPLSGVPCPSSCQSANIVRGRLGAALDLGRHPRMMVQVAVQSRVLSQRLGLESTRKRRSMPQALPHFNWRAK